jgi:hypothetical protein
MPKINFNEFDYYPDLLCEYADTTGYAKLSEDDKNRIVPIFALNRQRDAADLGDSEKILVNTIQDRSFILDIDKRPAPAAFLPKTSKNPGQAQQKFEADQKMQAAYNANLAALLDPADGFSAWRKLSQKYGNSVPVIQYTDPSSQKLQILRQGALLSANGQSVAIRVSEDSYKELCPIISQLLAIMIDSGQLLIMIDCGQGRTSNSERAAFAKDAIGMVLLDLDIDQKSRVVAVCISNSYTDPSHSDLKKLQNYDPEIWLDARDAFPFSYGDYAASYRPNALSSYKPWSWRPTVVYPLDDAWMVYRHQNAGDPDGFVEGAKAIILDLGSEPKVECWGADILRAANQGNLMGADSPKDWRAIKVNMHLHRQISASSARIDDLNPGFGETGED